MTDEKKYRACDRCRQRKRGCDGNTPCSNCTWTLNRNPNLSNICIYSAITVNNKTPTVTPTCEQCRVKKRKCDGGLPYCGVCAKSKVKDSNGFPICTYTKASGRKRKASESPTDSWERTLQNLTMYPTNFTPMAEMNPMGNISFSPNFGESSNGNILLGFNDPFMLPESISDPALDNHLFHLASIVLQAVPMTMRDKAIMLSQGGMYLPMSSALQYAMFASSAMFSLNPLLYPGIAVVSLKHRIQTAKRFASKALKYVNDGLVQLHFATIQDVFAQHGDPILHSTFEPLDLLDLIRAMLCLAHFSYGIGEGGTSMKLIHDVCHLSALFGVFVLITGGASNKSLWSVDSMVFRTPTDGVVAVPQNVTEEQERFSLWASCLVFDTYACMESGRPFALDERLYPEFVVGWRPRSFDRNTQPPGRPHTRGKNTVWENGPYSETFDNVSDICTYDLYPHSTSSNFNFVVWICVILRRILRVVRCRVPLCQKSDFNDNWWRETIGMHPASVKSIFMELPRTVTYANLHDSLLLWHANLPDRARLFSSLEIFSVPGGKPDMDESEFWRFSAPALEGTLLYLCAFGYLHMASLDSVESNQNIYKLSVPRYSESAEGSADALYSSRQILLFSLRAVTHILNELMKQSKFSPTAIPSPTQYWSIQPLELFIITSSGLLATRISPFNESNFNEAISMVEKTILPAITQFCNIWPIASHYKSKLETLVTNLKL